MKGYQPDFFKEIYKVPTKLTDAMLERRKHRQWNPGLNILRRSGRNDPGFHAAKARRAILAAATAEWQDFGHFIDATGQGAARASWVLDFLVEKGRLLETAWYYYPYQPDRILPIDRTQCPEGCGPGSGKYRGHTHAYRLNPTFVRP